MPDDDEKKFKFVCDDNLGKLARYLRVGGYDTAFDISMTDSEIIRISLDEGRTILTRDKKLIERTLVRDFFLIEDDGWPLQLKKVMNQFGLVFDKDRMFWRCLEDNGQTFEVAKDKIKDLVYPYIYQSQGYFRQCPICRRVYWPGTHVAAMLSRLKQYGITII